jgi:spermidine/putrescine transport system substrate-binding protein
VSTGPEPSRRSIIAGAAGLAGVAGLGPLLGACDLRSARAGTTNEPPLITPRTPVTWPTYPANPGIGGGLHPERAATLRVLSWSGRVSQQALAGFARAYRSYGCQVRLTTLPTIGQALAALRSSSQARAIQSGQAGFDVLLGLPTDRIGSLVWASLIQPLNHAYLPNAVGAWPRFRSPFYDKDNRYTVPYSVFTTGFAWRRDLLRADPYTSAAGWAFPWQSGFAGHVAMLDNYREALSLGLLSSGQADLNTADPRLIDTARQALLRLVSLTRARVSSNVSAELALGLTPLRQAWSGQAAAAAALLPGGVPADVIGYWFPTNGRGPVGSDTAVVPRTAGNPVLAHLFLNYLLDPANALVNFRHTGFQPPLLELTPQLLVRQGGLPSSLVSAAVLPTFYDAGLKELPLPGPVDQLWLQAWSEVRSRALAARAS